MDVIVLILLIVGIIFVTVSFFKDDLKCPHPQIIYRYVPENVIDTQFSEKNLPSNLYTDMFNNDNIWVGGMNMSMGKTVSAMSTKTTKKPDVNTGPKVK